MLHGWDIDDVHAELVELRDGVHVQVRSKRSLVKVDGQAVASSAGPLKSGQAVSIGEYHLQVLCDDVRREDAPARPPSTATIPQSPSVSRERAGPSAVERKPEAHHDQREMVDLYVAWRVRVHAELVKQMDLRRVDVRSMSDGELRRTTSELIQDIIEKLRKELPGTISPRVLAKQVLDEAIGLGPLEDMLADEAITEIMVNSWDQIFVERSGKLETSAVAFTSEKAALSVIERIVAPLGRRIDESSPMVDARLKDGSRVNAVIPPVALRGPGMTIRKFSKFRLVGDDLLRFGSLNQAMLSFLEIAVREKISIVVSGGTGSGKTTLLNVLSNFIPEDERIVTIEDAAELRLSQPNLVALEARPRNAEGKGEISIRDLVRNALRMRPDRIVVGECRGGEALDMLQAMNTGHEGSMTTAHANTPRDAISRLEVMSLMSSMDLPISVVREQIASAVELVIQQRRFPCGSRKITSISEVTGIESGALQLQEVFRFHVTDHGGRNGKVRGRFVATGAVPEFYEQLAERGVSVDLSIFDPVASEAA
ncbi:CpaF family protein [Dyella solisilvae]|nr:CpaF family protein [Dyella solisilvae]